MARLLVLVLSFAVLAALAAPARTDAGATIVASWDFEQPGDMDGWNASGGSFERVPNPVGPGQVAMFTTESAGYPLSSAARQVTLVPGATYRFGGLARVNDTAVDHVLRLELHWDANDAHYSQRAELAPASGGFRPLMTHEAVIPCNSTNPQLVVAIQRSRADAPVSAYVDDLQLERVSQSPCPTPVPPASPPAANPTSPPRTPTPGPGPPPPNGGPGGPSSSTDVGSTTNLLVNPGFELADDGRLVGWEDYGGVLLRVGSHPRSGRFAGAYSSDSASTKWAYQTVPVTSGAWYALQAHVLMNDPRVEAAYLRISWYSSDDGAGRAVATADSLSTLDTPSAAYRRLTTGAVQAPPGVHSARVRVLLRPRSSAGAAIYIDDASFRRANAPGVEEGSASGDGAASVGSSSSGGSGFGSSSVLGLRALGGTYDLLPTPVVVRSEQLDASVTPLAAEGAGTAWWPWALAGVALLVVGGGAGAWWWRRSGRIRA